MTVLQIIRDTPVTSRQNMQKMRSKSGTGAPKTRLMLQTGDWNPPESATDAINWDRSLEDDVDGDDEDRNPKADADGVNEDRSLESNQCQECRNDTRPPLQNPTMCNVASSNKCLDSRPPFQNPHVRTDHIKPRRPWKSYQKPASGHARGD